MADDLNEARRASHRASNRACMQRRRQRAPDRDNRLTRECNARQLARDPAGRAEKNRATSLAYLADLPPAKYLMRQMRNRSKQRGWENLISLEELEALLEPWTCALTGFPLRWDKEVSKDPLAPSPDRIDNSIGYVSGNVRIVAWMVNEMRGKYSNEEFLSVCRAVADANR